jgi:metallo-beta-lactamase family protein
MQLQFHGAVRSVTGSMYLLTVNGQRILLECGLYQGRRDEARRRNLELPFRAAEIDVVVLSHAHIDHSGNLPNLVKSGFRGDIFCTHATRDLAALMLPDSGRIQESDAEFLNKKRGRGDRPIIPIYTQAEAEAALPHLVGVALERTRPIAPGVHLTLYDAGHILGSAIVALDIEEQTTGRTWRLVFSGDLGRSERPLLNDPTPLPHADILIMESTYGDRVHKPDGDTNGELRDLINTTAQRGGKIIVPAFAVGRTQELVWRIQQLSRAGEIPADLPIIIDSPLAIDVTGVYRTHAGLFDAETRQFIENHNGERDLFGFGRLRYTRSVEKSKELNHLPGPAVIISASGMAEAGRILHHLRNNVEDRRNTVIIVGWTAPHTLGRRLAEGQQTVNIFGQPHRVRAQIATLNGLSAHADRNELLAWAGQFRQPPAHTFLVHGDEAPALALAQSLRGHHFPHVTVPHLHETFDF